MELKFLNLFFRFAANSMPLSIVFLCSSIFFSASGLLFYNGDFLKGKGCAKLVYGVKLCNLFFARLKRKNENLLE